MSKLCIRKEKQKKKMIESSLKIGGHLRKANEETILKISI